MFRDRTDAGRQLAKKLDAFRGQDAVVLALPRGGVVTGFAIAEALDLPLDIIAVRKIGHPSSPEYAIGAVDEKGTTILNEEDVETVPQEWLLKEAERERREATRRNALYRGGREPARIAGRIAIIVDDGVATGLTMQLAVRCAKTQNPKRIIVAVPAAPSESIRAISKEGADEVIVLTPPEEYRGSVGAHFREFDQVEDGEVIRLLESAAVRTQSI